MAEVLRRALDLYLSTVIHQRLAMLERKQPEPSLTQIEQFFEQFIEHVDRSYSFFGCLMCNTAVEVALHDKIVASMVQQYFDRLRQGFARSLARAKQNGEIADSTDIGQISELLVGSVLGLTTYARSSAPRQDVRTYISGILAMLKRL